MGACVDEQQRAPEVWAYSTLLSGLGSWFKYCGVDTAD